MDTKTPFVSDEQIRSVPMHDIDTGELVALEEMSPYRVRDLYEAELQALRDRMRLSQWLFTNLEDVILSFRGKQFPDGIGEVAFKEKSAHEFDVMYEPEGRFDLIYVRYNTFKRQFISASGYGVTLAISNNP